MYITIALTLADNLSAQFIGGYKALQSAFRKCRYCMAIDSEMQTKVCNSIDNTNYETGI